MISLWQLTVCDGKDKCIFNVTVIVKRSSYFKKIFKWLYRGWHKGRGGVDIKMVNGKTETVIMARTTKNV